MVDIQSPTAEIRQGKKQKEEESSRNRTKYNVCIWYAGRMVMDDKTGRTSLSMSSNTCHLNVYCIIFSCEWLILKWPLLPALELWYSTRLYLVKPHSPPKMLSEIDRSEL